MPRLISVRLAAVCALAIVLSLSAASAASAKGFSADLRVIGAKGKFLAEGTYKAATTSLKTSPQADCFGKGSGGSGKPTTIEGNTAMGLLAHAAQSTGSLRPLLISDSFDFGLALCGIGGSVAKGGSSWYLKINHKALQVGGDAATIKPGDDVLWALATSDPKTYVYPEELWLSAPKSATAGQPFAVRAFSYDEKGKRKPAAGVTVSGASAPTGADGKAMVTLSAPRRLLASKEDLIPSRSAVCVGGKCPAGS